MHPGHGPTQRPRDGTGALITLSAPGWRQSRFASTARSYLAANDPRVHFGFGSVKPDRLEIRWPSWVQALPGYAVGALGAMWTIQRAIALLAATT